MRGTNKQNQVLEESFESTKLFHQNLEDYFCAKLVNQGYIMNEEINNTLLFQQLTNFRL